MSTEQKSQQKVIIPDQLNIIIRTSVPGYQKIDYKPSMTIKDSDEKSIRFNPLIKLNESIVNKIPQEYRIKQFFNKGLFQSLLNYNGGTPAKDLLQATRHGYVDNNIKVTLNSIFPVGSVIYIGKKPYAIADHQWTTGDWKIDVKQKKKEIDPNKVTDPQLYTQLVRDEIITGEEQLNQISKALLFGTNYSGQQPTAKYQPPTAKGPPEIAKDQTSTSKDQTQTSKDQTQTSKDQTQTSKDQTQTSKDQTQTSKDQTQTSKDQTQTSKDQTQTSIPKTLTLFTRQPTGQPTGQPTTGQLTTGQPTGQPTTGQLTTEPLNVSSELVPIVPPKQPYTTNDNTEKTIKDFLPESESEPEYLSPEEDRLFDTFKKELKYSSQSTIFFKNYFKSSAFKTIVQLIFSKFSTNLKTEIRAFYFFVTNYEPVTKTDKLSNKSYEELCDQVSILKSSTDGDCFFKAVADGINIYNYENQNNKIIYANYGKIQLFTISILRELVFRYIENLGDEIINDMLLIAEEQIGDLNEKFKESINSLKVKLDLDELTKEQYLIELSNIYNTNSNFLVYKPKIVPIEIYNYNSPFRVLKKSEIQNYIKSKDYWANNIAIEAICDKLNICIIPIEKHKIDRTSGTFKMKVNMVDRLKTLLTNNGLVKEKCSNKVMFLFYQNNHYELIRFKYLTKQNIKTFGEGVRKVTEYEKKWYTIFRKNDLPPPLHILILIYGSIYSRLDNKNNFSIYNEIMATINTSVLKLLISNQRQLFINKFDDLFPNYKSIKSIEQESRDLSIVPKLKNLPHSQDLSSEENEKEMIGGEYPYRRQPYYRQPYYPRTVNLTKKEDNIESSKIAYTITIDMELHPGTSLTPEQISESKCNSRYSAIRKAFSEFTGKPYVIPPVYPQSKNNITQKNKESIKGGRRKTRKNI